LGIGLQTRFRELKEEGADIEGYGLEGYFKKSIDRLEVLRGRNGVSKEPGGGT